jgi:hypothetical protein
VQERSLRVTTVSVLLLIGVAACGGNSTSAPSGADALAVAQRVCPKFVREHVRSGTWTSDGAARSQQPVSVAIASGSSPSEQTIDCEVGFGERRTCGGVRLFARTRHFEVSFDGRRYAEFTVPRGADGCTP